MTERRNSDLIPVLFILILAAPVPIDAGAQSYPQWGDMRPGPYDVGFRVINTYDRSRGYWPAADAAGRRDTLETARPMQVSMWYPAESDSSAPRMVFGEYVVLGDTALGRDRGSADRKADAIESLRRGPLNAFFPDGVPDDTLSAVLATLTAAVRDATPLPGPFPLVVHAGFGLTGQSVLLEYLASHGYVVATYPLLGAHPAWYHRGAGTPEAYQAGADDIGFVRGHMIQLPNVDASQSAVVGMFSADGLLFQMQHMQLDALAVLDGGYPEELRRVPGFDTRAVRVPILDMPRTGYRDDRSLLDSLRYSDRYIVRFSDTDHLDFYQFQRIARPDRAHEHVSYKVIARYTLAFLDAVLRHDAAAANFLRMEPEQAGVPPGFMTIEYRPALPPTPTAHEFLLMIRNNEIGPARRAWHLHRKTAPSFRIVGEPALTTTLLFLRRDQGASRAVEAFTLMTEIFPESWRAWQHLGTTLQQAGARDSARAAYRRALERLEIAAMDPLDRKTYMNEIRARLREMNGTEID